MADDVEMKRVKQLMSKKDEIEKEIKQFKDILDSVRILLIVMFFLLYFCDNLVCLSAKRCRYGRESGRQRRLSSK